MVACSTPASCVTYPSVPCNGTNAFLPLVLCRFVEAVCDDDHGREERQYRIHNRPRCEGQTRDDHSPPVGKSKNKKFPNNSAPRASEKTVAKRACYGGNNKSPDTKFGSLFIPLILLRLFRCLRRHEADLSPAVHSHQLKCSSILSAPSDVPMVFVQPARPLPVLSSPSSANVASPPYLVESLRIDDS